MSEKRATTQFLVRLDPELHQRFRQYTFDHGLSMRAVVEDAIDGFMRGKQVECRDWIETGSTGAAVAA